MADASPLRDLPARFALPVVGDTLAFFGDPAGFLTSRARELGPVFKTKVLGDDMVCFVGPDAFTHFLDDKYFTRANGSPPHVQEIFGHGAVPFLEGKAFKNRKELLMQVFTEEAIDSYTPTIERVMKRFARTWAELGAFAWGPEITTMAMTTARALFLGSDPDTDDPRFEEAFGTVTKGVLTVPLKIPGTPFAKALRARDFILDRISDGIAAHQNTKEPRDDAMSRAMAARTKVGREKLSTDELQHEMFHFFAAYVPTIGALTMLAMFLALHGEVEKRLRAEIADKLPDGPITMARLRELPYLDAVCKESRRVQPVLPVTFFASIKEESSFRGVRIPAGMKAVGCIGATLLDDKTFPDPSRFDPDRWMGARPTDKQHMAWVPHGGGSPFQTHRCAGEWLADIMLKTFALVMLRGYDWTLPPQDLSPTKSELFAMPRSGLEVRLRRLGVLESAPPAPPAH